MAVNPAVQRNIGAKLRLIRKQKGYTCARLAEILGVSPSQITTVENTGSVSPSMMYRFAEALECEAKDFLPTFKELCEETVLVDIGGKTVSVSPEVAARISEMLKGEGL